MNSILAIVDINASNITSLRWMIQPYINILGPFAFPLIFMLGLMIVWSNVPTDKMFVVFGYMLILGFIGFNLFDPVIAIAFQILTGIPFAAILYLGLFKKGYNL